MAIKVARGQVTIIDQNDAVSLQAFIGSSQPLTQVFNKDTGAYAPSWAASPYPDIDPFSVCQRQGGRRPDLIRRQRGDIDSRCQERFRQWYKDGTVSNFRTGQLYDRRRFRQIRPDRQGQPHDRFRPRRYGILFEAIYIDANGLEIPFRAEVQFQPST